MNHGIRSVAIVAAMVVIVATTAADAAASYLQSTPAASDPCAGIATPAASGHGAHDQMEEAGTPAAGGHDQMMGDFDLMFIDMMIPHHQEAVDMANVVLIRSTNDEVRDLAEAVIEAQTREIAQMTEWRVAWFPDAGSEPQMPYENAMGMMGGSDGMMMAPGAMLAELCASPDVDLAFLQLMIPHHESAILMGQAAMTNAEHPELLALAEDVITTQAAEIAMMREMIAMITGTPVAQG